MTWTRRRFLHTGALSTAGLGWRTGPLGGRPVISNVPMECFGEGRVCCDNAGAVMASIAAEIRNVATNKFGRALALGGLISIGGRCDFASVGPMLLI